jgi:RimJ/RimL family protein N-acetyltransferase
MTEIKVELVPFGDVRNDTSLKSNYLSWLNDDEIVRLIASPALLNPKGPEFIEESFDRFTRPESQGFFIRYIPDNIFIGTAKLDGISEYARSAWDGIMIGDRQYHGRGLASHVYWVLLHYAFNELSLHRVNGGCNENNVAMIKTFEHLGYSLEGRLRQADCIDGEFSDHLYFGILRDEFLSLQENNILKQGH